MNDIDRDALFERTEDAMDVYEDEDEDYFEWGCGDSYCHICGDPPEWEDEDDETELERVFPEDCFDSERAIGLR